MPPLAQLRRKDPRGSSTVIRAGKTPRQMPCVNKTKCLSVEAKQAQNRKKRGGNAAQRRQENQTTRQDKHITPAPEDKSPPLLEIREKFNRNMNLIKLKFKDEMIGLQK